MAANDPFHRAGRGTLDRLLLAGRRSDSLPLRGGQLPGLDRRSGRTPFHDQPGGHLWGWRGIALAIVGFVSLLAAVGLSKLRIDDDLRSLLRTVDADFSVVDQIGSRFGAPDRDCIIRVGARSGDMFDATSLEEMKRLVESLEHIEGIEQVRSIFDIRRQGPSGALLPVIPRTSVPLDAEALCAARARSIGHPLIAGHLLSSDGSSSLLFARLAVGFDAPPRLDTVMSQIEAAITIDNPRSQTPGIELELTGLPALRDQASRALRRDMLIFNSLGLIFAVVLSATVAKSVRSTVVACVPPFVGAVWAIGLLGLFGAPINILTRVVPSLALVVGTCDSIHFIEDMRRSQRRGVDPLTASSGAISRVGRACGLTSLVTAIGFASLAAARIDAVRAFGIAAAAGAIASFLAVTLLTPLLASTRFCQGIYLGHSSRQAGRLAGVLTAFSVRHARPIAVIGCLGTLLLGLTCLGLDADNRVADALPQGAASARCLARVDSDFGGAMGVDVLVTWPKDTDWRGPAVLDALTDVHQVAVIGTIMAIAFRSPLLGIISLIPNIFPLAVIGAIVVLSGRSLDPATVIVFNVCLGLAVDDTVHVLSALLRQRRAGISITSAVKRAIAETGNPIVIGGVVLTVGFAAVTVSSVPSLASFGRLACAAVAAATVAELILLPALLVVSDTFYERPKPLLQADENLPASPFSPLSATG